MADNIARFRRIVDDESRTRVGDLVVVRWTTVSYTHLTLPTSDLV